MVLTKGMCRNSPSWLPVPNTGIFFYFDPCYREKKKRTLCLHIAFTTVQVPVSLEFCSCKWAYLPNQSLYIAISSLLPFLLTHWLGSVGCSMWLRHHLWFEICHLFLLFSTVEIHIEGTLKKDPVSSRKSDYSKLALMFTVPLWAWIIHLHGSLTFTYHLLVHWLDLYPGMA